MWPLTPYDPDLIWPLKPLWPLTPLTRFSYSRLYPSYSSSPWSHMTLTPYSSWPHVTSDPRSHMTLDPTDPDPICFEPCPSCSQPLMPLWSPILPLAALPLPPVLWNFPSGVTPGNGVTAEAGQPSLQLYATLNHLRNHQHLCNSQLLNKTPADRQSHNNWGPDLIPEAHWRRQMTCHPAFSISFFSGLSSHAISMDRHLAEGPEDVTNSSRALVFSMANLSVCSILFSQAVFLQESFNGRLEWLLWLGHRAFLQGALMLDCVNYMSLWAIRICILAFLPWNTRFLPHELPVLSSNIGTDCPG